MLFAVSAWSYHTTDLNLFQMADEAKKAGFDAIEVLDLPCEEAQAIDFAKRFRAHCDEIGLGIVSAANFADFVNGSNGDLDKEISRVCRKVDVAQALGISMMRHDAAWGAPQDQPDASFEDMLPRIIKGCRAVTEYAAARGIRTMTENHGQFAQGGDRMKRLIEGVGHPNYGMLVDIGNFLSVDDPTVESVRNMMPYAFHVHCKDMHVLPSTAADPGEGFFRSRAGAYLRGAIIGHGNVDVKGCLREVKNAGYDGALVLEFEGMEDTMTALRIGLANMQRYWNEI